MSSSRVTGMYVFVALVWAAVIVGVGFAYEAALADADHGGHGHAGAAHSAMGGPATLKLSVSGMHCPTCAASIQATLERLPGVKQAEATFESGEMSPVVVERGADGPSREVIVAAITKLGYQVIPEKESDH